MRLKKAVSVRDLWRSEGTKEFKRLASRLGVSKVIAATSKESEQGEYIFFINPDSWVLPDKRRTFIEASVTENKNSQGFKPFILIDIKVADYHIGEGIPGAIAHEIGHHIFLLANGRKKGWYKARPSKPKFLPAFHREGFQAWPETQEEIMAETLGQYLRGHKLNSVLLSEIKHMLAYSTRRSILSSAYHQSMMKILRNFRRSQIAKNSVAPKYKRKVAA